MPPAAPVVSLLGEAGIADWDAFVAAAPEATFFHRAGWRAVIERSFGHRTYYLQSTRDGRITGILPLVHMKHPLFGNALVSTAFCVYGGPVASDAPSLDALDREARALADRLDVSQLEYRSIDAAPRADRVVRSDLYATFRKAIDPDPERNMMAIRRKQRAMIRKGIKFGLESEIDASTDRLHRIYAESVRNLGTPVFPRRYFSELKAVFGEDCEILVIWHGARPIASVMSFYFRDEVLPYYGGGTAAARELAANDFMYWEVMRRAALRGTRIFDFGRSKYGTGSFEFKQHWNFEPRPLHYEYVLRRGAKPADVNPLNPKYRLFIAAWKHLPLPIANLVGPAIVRHLG